MLPLNQSGTWDAEDASPLPAASQQGAATVPVRLKLLLPVLVSHLFLQQTLKEVLVTVTVSFMFTSDI